MALFVRMMCHPGMHGGIIASYVSPDDEDEQDVLKQKCYDDCENGPLFCKYDQTAEQLYDTDFECTDAQGLWDKANSQKQLSPRYTRECLFQFWVKDNLAGIDSAVRYIHANFFRHVYATALYELWHMQHMHPTDMAGRPNPFLDMNWDSFVSMASKMMATGTDQFERTYCIDDCSHSTFMEEQEAAAQLAAGDGDDDEEEEEEHDDEGEDGGHG